MTPTRARLLHEYTAERIKDANAADYVRQPYRDGFPSRERVARWNREWLELERRERGLIVAGDKVRCDFGEHGIVFGTVVRVDESQIPYLIEYERTETVLRQTWADARHVTLAPQPDEPAKERASVVARAALAGVEAGEGVVKLVEAPDNVTRERVLACPYGCDAMLKQGLDGSWSCPRCCRSAPLEIVALRAFTRGQRSRDAELERVTRELAELRAQASERRATMNATHACEGCGKQSSIFTAGCDHCDYEDK